MSLLRKFLSSLARVWLGVLAGWFVRRGYFASKDAETYVDAAADWLVPAAFVAVPMAWAWVETKGRVMAEQLWVRLVVHAAAAPAGTPIATIEAAVKAGEPLVVIAREVHVGTPADCDDEGPQAA